MILVHSGTECFHFTHIYTQLYPQYDTKTKFLISILSHRKQHTLLCRHSSIGVCLFKTVFHVWCWFVMSSRLCVIHSVMDQQPHT